MNIKRLGVLSFAKFQAVLFGLLGVLAGIVYSVGGLIYDLSTKGLSSGSGLAFLAMIGMPILFAAVGFITGIVEASLFNLVARRFGGIRLNVEG
jgi:hypothetical protein